MDTRVKGHFAWHAVTLFCMCPLNIVPTNNCHSSTSVDATWMVWWNSSVGHTYTRSRVSSVCCSDNCRQHVCAVCVHASMTLVHFPDCLLLYITYPCIWFLEWYRTWWSSNAWTHSYFDSVQWPVVMIAAGGVVPVTSCGPLVHSSTCTLCVTLMACLSPMDVRHPLLSPHMHVHP